MAGLRFSTKESEGQCVMITGISMMLTWFVANLVSPTHRHIAMMLIMVRDPTLSGWMTSVAVEEKLRYLVALTGAGELLTATMARTQVYFVTLSFH